MVKKMIVSTLLLTIVTVNLFLWPYLYKEYKAGLDISNTNTVTVEKKTDTPPDGVQYEDETKKDSSLNQKSDKNNVEDNDTKEETNETFKVIDIK